MRGVSRRFKMTRNTRTAATCSAITSTRARSASTIQRGAGGRPAASHSASATTDSAHTNRMRRRSAGASFHSGIEQANSPSRVQPSSGCTACHCTMRRAPMSRASLALLLVSALWAQTPGDRFNKPPADVDEALRSRIAKFYQAHVDKKFRQADEYVAEDTKDFYYEASKPAYLDFEIKSIAYSDNFTKANVVVHCKTY